MRIWRRVCAARGQLDERTATVAPANEGEARLAAEPWRCPSCGSSEYTAGHRMSDEDLEEIVEAREEQQLERRARSKRQCGEGE